LSRRSGLSVLETLIGVVVGLLVLSMAGGIMRWARVCAVTTLGTQMELQMETRRALVEFIKELQENIEIAEPPAGATLNYCLTRDKLNQLLLCYTRKNDLDSKRAGRPLHDLYMYRYDYGATPPAGCGWLVLSHLERVAFTSLSSGLIQIHLDFYENGRSYPVLTAVRTRNIYAESVL
jgi:hypothetical protein